MGMRGGQFSMGLDDDARRLRDSIRHDDEAAMGRLKAILEEAVVDLDPIAMYVMLDKLRGQRNSAGIPQASWVKAEQTLRVLGLDRYWPHA